MTSILAALFATSLPANASDVRMAGPRLSQGTVASARLSQPNYAPVRRGETAEISLNEVITIDGSAVNGTLPKVVVEVGNNGGNQYRSAVDVEGTVAILTPDGTTVQTLTFVIDDVAKGSTATWSQSVKIPSGGYVLMVYVEPASSSVEEIEDINNYDMFERYFEIQPGC